MLISIAYSTEKSKSVLPESLESVGNYRQRSYTHSRRENFLVLVNMCLNAFSIVYPCDYNRFRLLYF